MNSINNESYEFYRGLMEDPDVRVQSAEVQGVMQGEFDSAINDPRSAVLEYQHGEQTMRVPLAVPLDHMPWYNRAFFDKLLDPGAQVFYYTDLPNLLEDKPDDYTAALEPVITEIASNGGLLVTEHAHTEATIVGRNMRYIARRLGMSAVDTLQGKTPTHYVYDRQSLRVDLSPPTTRPVDLAQCISEVLASGKDIQSGSVCLPSLEDEDVDRVWEYYDLAFRALNNIDPVLASFDKPALREILKSEKFHKFVYLNDGDIDSLLLVADVRDCTWLNQRYYLERYPEAYPNGNVITSPGAVTNPESSLRQGGSMMQSNLNLIMESVAHSGSDLVMSFVCDDVSNQIIPRLAERSINRTGWHSSDFTYPSLLHVFRAFRFANS